MNENLGRVARAYGVDLDYLDEWGRRAQVSEAALRGVLSAMGVPAEDGAALERALRDAPPPPPELPVAPQGARCFMPDWLAGGRAWGVTCQLYGLRSRRNWGIGDFADLARLAEIAAAAGADFVGVNPLHALFLAEPDRSSPFSPSNRSLFNPIYVAVDEVDGYDAARHGPGRQALETARDGGLVDYSAVTALKLGALERIFAERREESGLGEEFEAFLAGKGASLRLHALFEALSERFMRAGVGSGWHVWPEEYRSPDDEAVRAFERENAERVLFHAWLQFVADRQLARAQAAALNAGMRVGLYLDLAVSVAPDGSATWSDPTVTVAGARVGAPPGIWNEGGQDWGLAPLSPTVLRARDAGPFREMMASVAAHCGAIRIDHAMGIFRLYWVPERLTPRDGAFVRYPMDALVATLASVSQERQAVVIGEDLGTVPPGFREAMYAAEIQSNLVVYFERDGDRFLPPQAYLPQALATISNHDLPTLAGWWRGQDIRVRSELGVPGGDDPQRRLTERRGECRLLLAALAEAGLLPEHLRGAASGEAPVPEDLPREVLVAVHRFAARTPCRLFGVQIEELTGAVDQPNLPGTTHEHPNWLRRIPIDLDELPAADTFLAIADAVRGERPKHA
jgi:4-alpha-glucanotransferase